MPIVLLRKNLGSISFDDEATNIEDRIWGKKVTDAGFNIVYEPSAEVFHHHGIHHGQSDNRARSTFQILKQVESFDSEDALQIA